MREDGEEGRTQWCVEKECNEMQIGSNAATLCGGHEGCVDCYEIHNGPQLLQFHELNAKLGSKCGWNKRIVSNRLQANKK